MVLERFNDAAVWEETDPNGNLSQTQPKSQWTSLERRDGDCQLLRDNGPASIPVLFDYWFELEVEALEAGDASSRPFCYPVVINESALADPYVIPYIALQLTQVTNDDTIFTSTEDLNVFLIESSTTRHVQIVVGS